MLRVVRIQAPANVTQAVDGLAGEDEPTRVEEVVIQMTTSVYKLTNDQIKEKVHAISHRLFKHELITRYEYNVLQSMVGRLDWALGQMDSTNQWALKAFDEVERLTKLIRERWEAGFRGIDN